MSLEHRSGRIVALIGGRDFASNQFNLATQGRDASEYWKEGRLREIPGVGVAIAEKIDELLRREG